MGHAFISYSRTDRAYVEKLASHLAAAGVPVWYDYQIEAGESFSERIEDAIDKCSVFLPVLTPDAVSSKWVKREIARAERNSKPMRPLLRAECNPPLELNGLHYEDVKDGELPSAGFVAALGRLISGTSAPPGPAVVSEKRPSPAPPTGARQSSIPAAYPHAHRQQTSPDSFVTLKPTVAEPSSPESSPPEAADPVPGDRSWSVAAHLGGVLLGFLAPLSVLIIKGIPSSVVRANALAALGFQLPWGILAFWLYALASLVERDTVYAAVFVTWAITIFFSIRGAAMAARGIVYRYPLSIQMVRSKSRY